MSAPRAVIDRPLQLIVALAITILAASPLLAQQHPATVNGSVTAASGEPLANARIMIEEERPGQHEYATVSDSQGYFAVSGIEPGRYFVLGDKDGYYRPKRNGGNQFINLNEGESEDVVIHLAVTGTISGRVMDENRQPMPGIHVEALQQIYRGNGRALVAVGRPAQTDDNGEYRLYWLKPGKYLVRATSSGKIPAKADEFESYAPAYFPGSMDRTATLPLTLGEGEEISAIDLTMLPASSLHISGSVINTAIAQPVAVSDFYLVPRDPHEAPFARSFSNSTLKTGAFELHGVESGAFYLYPLIIYKGVTYSGRASVDVAGDDIDGAAVTISSGEDVVVQVRYEDGSSLDPRLNGLEVRLIPANGTPEELTPKPLIIGNHVSDIANVAIGDYNLSIPSLPADTFIQSATLDGHNIETSSASIANPTGPGSLEIVLNGKGGTVGGRVSGSGGNPLENAVLVLASANLKQRQSVSAFMTAISDQNGSFTIQGVPPGDYKLFAWDEMEDGAYLDPAFLDPFEAAAATVHVDESGVTNVQIQVLTGGR